MLADAEVGQEGVLGAAAAADEDVGGLDVAMDEAVVVRLVERVGDLRDQVDGARAPRAATRTRSSARRSVPSTKRIVTYSRPRSSPAR